MSGLGKSRNLDPLVAELVDRLPPQDADWPLDERLKWFRAMAAAIDLCYARPNEDRELVLAIKSRLPPARND